MGDGGDGDEDEGGGTLPPISLLSSPPSPNPQYGMLSFDLRGGREGGDGDGDDYRGDECPELWSGSDMGTKRETNIWLEAALASPGTRSSSILKRKKTPTHRGERAALVG